MKSKSKSNSPDESKVHAALVEAIKKTGFPLEHQVADAFKTAGWNTIGGKYYIDDVDGRARELDLIVYRVKTAGEFSFVTALLISCKKDAAHKWVFMSRDRPDVDPNHDWFPLQWWCGVEMLEAYLNCHEWKTEYLSFARETLMEEPTRDFFAYQLVRIQESGDGFVGTPSNDKPIFDSISGLLKALDFELNELPTRAKKNRMYMFHLAVVADSELCEMKFAKERVTVVQSPRSGHLARFMVRQRQVSAIVNFVQASEIAWLVRRANQTEKASFGYFKAKYKESKEKVLEVKSLLDVFEKKYSHELLGEINAVIYREGLGERIGSLSFYARKKGDALLIELGCSSRALVGLEKSESIADAIKKFLRIRAGYVGDYELLPEIPF